MTVGLKTNLKSDFGNKSSSLPSIDLWGRVFVDLLLRTFRNCPDSDLSIPPTYQQALLRCTSDVGFLRETGQSSMVLSPELLDWYNYRRCVESCDIVRLGIACEWRSVALPPDTRMLRPLVSNVANALTSFLCIR